MDILSLFLFILAMKKSFLKVLSVELIGAKVLGG